MALARTTVFVFEDSPLRGHPHVRESGEVCAWLEVGERVELSVWGSSRALRRFAAAVTAAADAADHLAEAEQRSEPVAQSAL
jgi:hypothetical protein